MSKPVKNLDPDQVNLLARVAEAAFANPFSDARDRLDSELSGLPPAAGHDERLAAVVKNVRDCMSRLADQGIHTPSDLPADQGELMLTACLFCCFHDYMDDFDRLIEKQLATPDASVPVPFARKALAEMRGFGVGTDDSHRYFAMFYQMRRAFYFIGRALLGCSTSMSALRRSLWSNVFTQDTRLYERYLWNRMEDFSTLLLGETGTGKGAAANAIGRSGFIPFDESSGHFAESFMRSFQAINLSQFPESLIESELFGHRKGAFTGAIEAHEGVFARCSPHGAIFLDEIGDVSIPIQIKLLKVIQERTFSPVGSHEQIRFQGRVIAASNRSVDELRERKLFRDDFYYRLCSDVIIVPPLRQRISEDPSELKDLVGTILHRIIGESGTGLLAPVMKTIARDLPADYQWPGNVRELEQCVRRILLTQHYTPAAVADPDNVLDRLTLGIARGSYEARDLLADYCRLLHSRCGTYEEVGRRTGLDRRTVRKYMVQDADPDSTKGA